MEKIKAFISKIFSYNKRMVIISMSCILAGFFATGIGFALVDYDIYKLNPDPDTTYEMIEKEIAIEDIDDINIDVSHMDIVLESIEGDAFKLQYTESEDRPMKIDSSSKTLSIKRQEKIHFFQFNWMNLSDKDYTLTLQIPKAYTGNLDVSNAYGSIDIKDIKGIKEVSIENSHDELNVQNIEATRISLVNAYGSIKANNLVSQNDLSVENEHDDIELRDVQAKDFHGDAAYSNVHIDTMKLLNNFALDDEHNDVELINIQSVRSQIDVSYGSVVMKDWISDDITIDVEHGDVTSDILGKEKDYHIISDVENGESNLAKERNEEKEKKFTVTLSYGDVDVSFSE